jgi:hypothetical protein
MNKQESANLILKLYDLRREATMREARNWFFTFNPTGVQDFFDALLGEHSGHYRMVVSYWDMAASMVNQGAIDEELFNASGGELVFVYAKIAKFLPELRQAFGSQELLQNMETLVKRIPDIDAKIEQMNERMKQMMAMRAEREKGTQSAAAQA